MLMKYAAVTLLFAALITPAVLAQSPDRERPSSPRPKGEVREEEVAVKPQPGVPLRLSVKAYVVAETGYFQLKASVENISDRDIGTYSIRRAAVGSERPGNPGWGGRLPTFGLPGKILRPGQVDVKGGQTWTPLPSRDFPDSIFEVHSVVFTDGTIWCADVCRAAEYKTGRYAGERAATDRLLKVLSDGGLDAVIKALMELVVDKSYLMFIQAKDTNFVRLTN